MPPASETLPLCCRTPCLRRRGRHRRPRPPCYCQKRERRPRTYSLDISATLAWRASSYRESEGHLLTTLTAAWPHHGCRQEARSRELLARNAVGPRPANSKSESFPTRCQQQCRDRWVERAPTSDFLR